LSEADKAWERVDSRILGQLLAAQNLLFLLPDEARIGEFFGRALSGVPGVASCSVCLGTLPADPGAEVCRTCVATRRADAPSGLWGGGLVPESCLLAAGPEKQAVKVGTGERVFGFFVFQVESQALLEPYLPFLSNLGGFVALSLENRLHRGVIEKARDELEARVDERTRALTTVNAQLAAQVRERRLAEEELSRVNERLVMATRAGRLGVWDWDRSKDELIWDDQMYALLGTTRAACPSTQGALARGIHPDDDLTPRQALERVPPGASTYEAEVRVVWPDQTTHHLRLFGQIVRGPGGEPQRVAGVAVDVTERRLAELEGRRLNQELEQRVAERTAQLEGVNRELEAFSYSVSHDLRAPLRHIDGFITLLQKRSAGALDEQSRHYMETIASSARRMGALIDDLLSFSRMGRVEMSRTRVALEAVVREVLAELEPETHGRVIEWVVAPLPEVVGDRAMLRTAVFNLVANALKFTRTRARARIEIGCRAGSPSEASETVFFVKDNGVGFEMKYAQKLFGVFQRLHSREEFEGTGIGLANVRRVVARHEGRVWAEGVPGEGATFWVALPAAAPRR
jgi:signal transduction histidine kinase